MRDALIEVAIKANFSVYLARILIKERLGGGGKGSIPTGVGGGAGGKAVLAGRLDMMMERHSEENEK